MSPVTRNPYEIINITVIMLFPRNNAASLIYYIFIMLYSVTGFFVSDPITHAHTLICCCCRFQSSVLCISVSVFPCHCRCICSFYTLAPSTINQITIDVYINVCVRVLYVLLDVIQQTLKSLFSPIASRWLLLLIFFFCCFLFGLFVNRISHKHLHQSSWDIRIIIYTYTRTWKRIVVFVSWNLIPKVYFWGVGQKWTFPPK